MEHVLEFGWRQVVLADPDAAQRFPRALAATVEEARCPPRRRDAFARSRPADLVQNLVERDESTVQRRIADDDGLVERRDACGVDHSPGGGGDRQPAQGDDVGCVEPCGVDVDSRGSAAAGGVVPRQMHPFQRKVAEIHAVQKCRRRVAHHDAGWARLQGCRNAGPVQRRRIECGEALVGDVCPRRDSHETSGIAGMPDLGIGDAVG
ncbi:hypothetical protein [Rhodococcus opacus]|uniref:hypothetical protein n=1 Tax=Rhodococcus opacus TaxID=37919 RepID=UPI0002A2AD5F|nr:hypothetical protein Rwratislav_13058 [Rhodococcus wratislaviensis IFP 2016]NKY72295.1 hypothetical protein [Rhodococcus opacus]